MIPIDFIWLFLNLTNAALIPVYIYIHCHVVPYDDYEWLTNWVKRVFHSVLPSKSRLLFPFRSFCGHNFFLVFIIQKKESYNELRSLPSTSSKPQPVATMLGIHALRDTSRYPSTIMTAAGCSTHFMSGHSKYGGHGFSFHQFLIEFLPPLPLFNLILFWLSMS